LDFVDWVAIWVNLRLEPHWPIQAGVLEKLAALGRRHDLRFGQNQGRLQQDQAHGNDQGRSNLHNNSPRENCNQAHAQIHKDFE
jgi:hypothetical protein